MTGIVGWRCGGCSQTIVRSSWRGSTQHCDGDPLGFIALVAIPCIQRAGLLARVSAIAVQRNRQGRGIGRQLLEAGEAWAKDRGCVDIEIPSSRERAGAHAFYQHLQYADVCARSARFKRSLE